MINSIDDQITKVEQYLTKLKETRTLLVSDYATQLCKDVSFSKEECEILISRGYLKKDYSLSYSQKDSTIELFNSINKDIIIPLYIMTIDHKQYTIEDVFLTDYQYFTVLFEKGHSFDSLINSYISEHKLDIDCICFEQTK